MVLSHSIRYRKDGSFFFTLTRTCICLHANGQLITGFTDIVAVPFALLIYSAEHEERLALANMAPSYFASPRGGGRRVSIIPGCLLPYEITNKYSHIPSRRRNCLRRDPTLRNTVLLRDATWCSPVTTFYNAEHLTPWPRRIRGLWWWCDKTFPRVGYVLSCFVPNYG